MPQSVAGMTDRGARIGRLRWQSRRGLLDLDRFFETFFAGDLSGYDEATITALERLMDCQDLEMLDWLLGRSAPQDPQLQFALDLLRHR